MGEFNSDGHYIYYSGQESLRRNGVALKVNKRVWNSVLGCNLNNRMISVRFQGKAFDITEIWVCAPTTVKEAEVKWSYEDLQELLELTPKKDVLFIIGRWNVKLGSQEIPGVTGKFGLGVQNEAGQMLIVLPREHTGYSKHCLPTLKKQFYIWTLPDGQYRDQIACILCSQRWRCSKESAKQDLELTVTQIISSLLQNLGSNWKKGKPLGHSGMT